MKRLQVKMNWKDLDGIRRDLILRYYTCIRFEVLRNITKNLNHNSRSAGPYLNPGPHEYEAGVLTIQLRRSSA
jgi:hypothetical protein